MKSVVDSKPGVFSYSPILLKAKQIVPSVLPVLLFSSRSVADFTVLILGLMFLIKSYVERDWAWAKQPWFRASLLFWAYLLLVNAPLSINPFDSFTHAVFFIRWPLFAAAIAYWLLNTAVYQRQFLLVLMAVILFIVGDTWWQYFFDKDVLGHLKASKDRLTGPFSKPIPGIMLLRVMFVTLFAGLLFRCLHTPFKWIFYILFVMSLGILTIFITGERMAFLLCLSGAMVVVIGLWCDYSKLRVVIAASVLLLLALLLTTIFLAPETANRSVYSLIFKLQHFADSDYGKVFIAAWQAWREYFVFGSGFHTYKTACEQISILGNTSINCSHPHNLYLQIGAETGLVGLILFVLVVLSIYHAAIRPLIQARAWTISALSFVVLSVSFWPFIGGISILNNWVAAFVWLGVGWVIAMALRYNNYSLKPDHQLS